MQNPHFGPRIKALREARKLTQEELALQFGFKDRQTVSSIETGERRLTADELLRAVQVLGTSIEELTDPFVLVGDEARFSWRQTGVATDNLLAFEHDAGRWIATFRRIAPEVGYETPLLRHSLPLSTRSSFEEAMAAGERFVASFDFGEVPARRLAEVMEEKLGILVLMVNAIDNVSGAACRLSELDAVLINRNEAEGRRAFDLAHELFHILTWAAMPPDHSEDASETSRSRVEQLANKFASAVLMPSAAITRFGDWSGMDVGAIVAKLNQTADALAVTASALKWRLVDLKILSQAVARQVNDALLRNNGRTSTSRDAPLLYSRRFMQVIARGVDDGLLSARRASALLGVPLDDIADLCHAYGIELDLDL